ncbi:MAG: phosphoribosylglycinamide formyltransferase [Candidatus Heimdallarchaeota archaeon]|nr:phosphoribosylglycinamide formyltransferase [Candidatus Heimdallarchaeota archaeon]
MMRTAVLISGRGTNLEAILKAEEEKSLGKTKIVLVLSNNPEAKGLEIAQRSHKQTAIVDKKNLDYCEQESEILEILEHNKIEFIVLAGFMQILSSNFISKYKNKIINIHPSLLPSFPGLKAQKQALDFGVKISGCTVHIVTETVDEGPIILQKCVEVYSEDSEKELADRILREEHVLLPKAISLFSLGKIQVYSNKARIVE